MSYNILLISFVLALFPVNNPFAENLGCSRWHEMEMLPLQFKTHFLSFQTFIFETSILKSQPIKNVLVPRERSGLL